MIAGLGTEFHLAQALMCAPGSLPDGAGKQLGIHKMGAGAGDKITAVTDKLQTPQIDLPVALHCVLNGITGFGEGRRIQDHHILGFPISFQLRKQVKHICTGKPHSVLQVVQNRIFRGLLDGKLGGIYA